MKKILSLVVVLAIVAQVNAKGIEPETPMGVSVLKSGSVVKLFYRAEESGTVKVAIYNEKGSVLHKEIMRDTEDFMRPYNFSALPPGVYTIELTDKSGTKYKKVEHRILKQKLVAKLTRLKKDELKYMLAVPDCGTDALSVRIYNDRYQLMYEETQTVDGDFAKVYNLNNLGGKHIFEIADKAGNRKRIIQSPY